MADQTIYQFSEADRRGLQNFISRVDKYMGQRPGTNLNRTSFDTTSYLVKLTGRGEVEGSFKFKEVRYDLDTTSYIDKPNGITEQVAGHAFDASGLATIPLNVVVTIKPDYSIRESGVAVYTFDYPSKYIWAKITGSTANGSNKWKYSWQEQTITSGSFSAPDNPLTGTTSTNFAINSLEASNTGSGIQGNGVNVDNLPDGFSLLPASTGTPIVQLYEVIDGDSKVFVFSLPNPVDGEC